MPFCPNLSNDTVKQEFTKLQSLFGNEIAYFLWDSNNGHMLDKAPNGEPSKLYEAILDRESNQEEALKIKAFMYSSGFKSEGELDENGEPFIDDLYQGAKQNVDEAYTKHEDPEVQAAIDQYGVEEIHDWNNPHSWALEKKYGIIERWETRDGKRIKIYNGFTFNKANLMSKKIRQEGGYASMRKVFKAGRERWIVKVGRNVGLPIKGRGSKVTLAGIEYDIKVEDLAEIERALKYMDRKGLDANLAMKWLHDNYAYIFEARPDLEFLYQTMAPNLDKLSHVEVEFFTKKEELDDMKNAAKDNADPTYMYFEHSDTILLNRSYITKVPNAEAFVSGFMHETMHAFTEKAIHAPKDIIDITFAKAITAIYDEAKAKFDPEGTQYGYSNVSEFMSVFLTAPSFANQLKEEKSLYRRILEAIARWFSTIAGKDAVIGTEKSLYDRAYSVISDYMNKQSDFAVNLGSTGGAYMKAKSTIKASLDKADFSTQNPKHIEKALRDIIKQFTFNEKDHTFKHKETGTYYTPVTELMANTRGFGFKETPGVEKSPKLIRGGNLGTAIHKSIEGILSDVAHDILKETGFEVTDEAKGQLKEILKQFEGKDVTVLSEVFVADPEMKVAGLIDLVIIDKEGRISILDFKTKEVEVDYLGFEGTTGFYWYKKDYKPKGVWQGHSMRTKAHLQMSIYKHIIEKTLGFRVKDMTVVLLKGTINQDSITKVEIDRTIEEDGLDRFFHMQKDFARIYGESQVDFGLGHSQLKLTIDEEIDDEDWFSSEEFLKWSKYKSELTKAEALLSKTKKSLKDKLDVMQNMYSFQKRKSFEEFYNRVQEAETDVDSFGAIVTYAYRMTNQIWSQYQEILNSEDKAYTPELLYNWKDYLMAYDMLDEVLEFAIQDDQVFNKPNTTRMLTELVTRKNTLKRLYTSEGKKLIAEWLTPYFNGIRAKFKEQWSSEYRVKSRDLRKKKKYTKKQIEDELGTEEQYVGKLLDENKTDLNERTYRMLLNELTVASRDINDITRWFDNMLDTRDPVAAAMVEAFVEADEKSRLESLETRITILNKLRDLEKYRSKGANTSEIDFYKFLLEHDKDGKPNGYILKPWNNILLEEEKKQRTAYSKEFTVFEVRGKMAEWMKDKMWMEETDRVEFNKKLDNYLLQLVKAKEITEDDYNEISKGRENYNIRVADLVKNKNISEKAGELTMAWVNENRWLYSSYSEKYQSKEWNGFMKTVGVSTNQPIYDQMEELRESKHALADFYNFIDDLSTKANALIPYGYRIGYRLPGVAKTNLERIKEGQNPATYFKETSKADFLVRPEDTERGNHQQITDEKGEPKYFLPVHYTAKLEPENQSYDIAGIYFRFWESANDYHNKRQILPQMEMAKFLVDERSAKKRDSFGNILEKVRGRFDKEGTKANSQKINNTKLAAQLNDWFEMAVYGRRSTDPSLVRLNEKYTLDTSKLADTLNRYTSMVLLGGNLVQGTANVIIGETMQAVDAIAGEWVTVKSLSAATARYSKWLPGMVGDVGLRAPNHVGSLIVERFNIMHDDPGDINFARTSKGGQLANLSSLFFLQKAGEHWMQSRYLFAKLLEKKAYDKNGKLLGSMLDQYYSEKGTLKIKPDVDLVKSRWTETEQTSFLRKTKGQLSRMHGEYSDLGRVAIQRLALGRMAYMFRKFVIPGFKRRWQSKQYIQRLDQYVEGNYITTGKFLFSLGKDLATMKLYLMGQDWAALSNHEKANVKRTLGEVVFLISAIILAKIAFIKLGDEDDEEAKRMLAFLAYQGYRLKAEMLFWTPKIDEAMSIMRSPMASMSVIENVIKLMSQVWHINDLYERGPWKGQPKITRTMINFVPMYKQYFKVRDIAEQINWFMN